jgi:prepilin-type N-terminal cleavage/methylation domain-containing protein
MNKRGFTLIELIAVIVILGVLLSITTMSVTSYLNETKEKSFESLVESVETSAQMYIADHSNDFPELNTVGSTFDIELADLVNNNYISDHVQDPRTNDSIPLTTKIHITVVSKDNITVDFMYQ